MFRPGARQHGDAAAAIGKYGREIFQSKLRNLVDTQWQHMRRQSDAEPGQCIDQCVAMLAVVKQHDGIAAAGHAVGLQQRA